MSKLIDGKMKVIVIIVAILVVLFTGGIFYYFNGIGAVDANNDESVTVTIPNGSGSSAIIEILDDSGLIKNKTCAKIHARVGGYDSLQANSYVFNKTMTLSEIFEAINTGDFNYILKQQFTIVEGSTIPQAAEAIASEMPFTQEEILAKWSDRAYLDQLISEYWFITEDILKEGIMYPLEGYLYPETYFVTDGEPTIEGVTTILLQKMDEELTKRKADIEAFGMSIHDFLTFSSIVVWEAGTVKEDDAQIIAGVFLNRLNDGMPFESDATVNYAQQKRTLSISYDDLQVDSLYNTYLHPGIPIGPICAIPANIMDAVLNHQQTDYYYFFAMEDGEVVFSKTFEEHDAIARENVYY